MTNPKISLCICTYNRCRYLPEALESVKNQQIEKADFELLLIDNNSTDETAAITKAFIAANPGINARYIFEPVKGLSAARNRGLSEAKAPVINYVDDDAILAPEYLAEMLSFFDSHVNAVGAGGKVIPKYEAGEAPRWMNKYLDGFVGKKDHGAEIRKFTGKMKYPVGCNMAYKKEVLLKAGGFNDALQFRSDDKYIFYQVSKISDKVYYVPGATLQHYIDAHRLDPENFKKLFLKTGNEEKKRIRGEQGTAGVIKKGIEFMAKAAAATGLFALYTAKGEYEKGKYIFLSQYNTLKGFFKKEVFVR